MKTLISILIVLLVSAGCGKKEQHSNPNDKNGTATSVEATDKSPKATKVIPNSPEAKAVIDKAIRKAANKPSGELTAADLEKVTQLELREAGITDLSPLKGLSNLKRLSLGENQITDIKPIEGLTQLEDLWLDSNKIQDLTPLAGMTKLQRLMLHINQISDLKPLVGLTEINYFALTDNLVEDLTPLEGMKKLQQLFLLRNPSLTTVHVEKLQAKLPECTISHNAKSEFDVEIEAPSKDGSKIAYYTANVKQLANAMSSYVDDNYRFPPPDKWSDSIEQYIGVEDLKKCLVKDKQTGLSIMYNSELNGKRGQEITNRRNTVVFFLSKNGGWNKSGGAKEAHTHDFGEKGKDICIIGFADTGSGAVKFTPENNKKLIWSLRK